MRKKMPLQPAHRREAQACGKNIQRAGINKYWRVVREVEGDGLENHYTLTGI